MKTSLLLIKRGFSSETHHCRPQYGIYVVPDIKQQLQQLQQNEATLTLAERFAAEPRRFQQLSFMLGQDWLADFSKQAISPQALQLLCQWAKEQQLDCQLNQLFKDNCLNNTEQRAVLHTALRMPANAELNHDGENVIPNVHRVLAKMRDFCQQVHSGQWRGASGKAITHVVNLGIGGSDLGPAMVVKALRPYQHQDITAHFVSNMDGADLAAVLDKVDAERTLFVVSSKTFTTSETLTNAHSAKQWLLEQLAIKDSTQCQHAVARHFVAVSTNLAAVAEFGIAPANCFEFWDWVGGRFSLWSAVGLSIALAVGFAHFEQLLAGAHQVDEHLQHTPFEQNVPVLLALVSHWNTHYLKLNSETVFPYSQDLALFPDFLQQLAMESNGKSVDKEGGPVTEVTSPLVWGAVGTNGQHAFFQLFHQGSHQVAADFIGVVQASHSLPHHQNKLLANLFAQTEALAFGRSQAQVEQGLKENGQSADTIARLAPYKVMEGNRASTTLLCRQLTPANLGALIALYEHKTVILGLLWNINSFDQWGVELGKQLAVPIAKELAEHKASEQHDSSTNGLIKQACLWQTSG